MQTITKYRLIIVTALLLAMILVALLSIHYFLDPGKRVENLLSASEALMNLFLVVIIGGTISYIFKRMEQKREELFKVKERERDGQKVLRAFREEFLRDFLSAYQKIKASRRTLRRNGLLMSDSSTKAFSDQQLSSYEAEMGNINEAQLKFEWLVAEVKNTPDAFAESGRLRMNLRTVESYLRGIHREFEDKWRAITGKQGPGNLEMLPKLIDFTGPYKGSIFDKKFCAAKDEVLRLIRRDLLPLTFLEGVSNKSLERNGQNGHFSA